MKSVYFIPSNRNIEKCLTSYMKEIDFAQKKYGIHIPIVVPETNDKQFVAQNARTINLLQEKYPKIEILHLTTKLQEAYFDILLAGKTPSSKKCSWHSTPTMVIA